ncbi:flagellar biosynthesis protein FlhB [Phenylobacterium montanum]|uniref:Flagellar biosynthetic protein FlhB n=1 Tax=Phenylobacterium montanum TaxID=2823693 RepID=A0A975IUE0_9CAUL|nr:flagellar biosynthesis protein FlhB [Caulobacter sp. S6]QUD87842.1 flagellar biosynthesis protein FlhB [Caulobacter sp. S6]
MAEENADGGSKTEEASQRKLDEARKQGDVAKSPDLPAWASLAAATSVVLFMGAGFSRNLADQMRPFIERPESYDLENGGAVQVMQQALTAAAPIVIAVLGAAAIAGVAGNVLQTGFLLSPNKLAPDFSRLSPMKGLQRMFGLDGLVNFGKSALKIALTGVVAWMAIRPHVADFQQMQALDPLSMLPETMVMIRALFLAVLMLLGGGALIDWIWQRQRFLQRMRMTKEEQKEDYKQSEGDPKIKAKIRQIRYERARRRMMQNVPKATVVVMNPTHYAVALRYVQGETPAPECVAKGLDSLALKIREVAEAHNVPVIEDPPLARALYATVEVDETIPHEHYEAVAKVIGFVLQGARRRPAQRRLAGAR